MSSSFFRSLSLTSLLVLMIFSATPNFRSQFVDAKNERSNRRRNLLGGFSSVKDTKSEEINKVVDFIEKNLKEGKGPTVTFASKISMASEKIIPLEVSKQVVAGINYRMKLGFFKETSEAIDNGSMLFGKENCVGGISVLVFRSLQGEYSVGKWGNEMSCEHVVALLNENEGDE